MTNIDIAAAAAAVTLAVQGNAAAAGRLPLLFARAVWASGASTDDAQAVADIGVEIFKDALARLDVGDLGDDMRLVRRVIQLVGHAAEQIGRSEVASL